MQCGAGREFAVLTPATVYMQSAAQDMVSALPRPDIAPELALVAATHARHGPGIVWEPGRCRSCCTRRVRVQLCCSADWLARPLQRCGKGRTLLHDPTSRVRASTGEPRARFQGIGQPQRHSWSNRPSTAAPSSSITSAASMERPRRWNAAAAAVRAVRQPPYDASTGGGRPAGNSRTCRPARRPPTFTHIPAASEFCSVRLRMRRASRTRNYICAADLHTYTRAGLLGLLQHQGADVGGSGEGGCAPAWPPSAYRNSPPTTGTPRRSQT